MKLYFLGTSHGVPAGDRFCSCYVLEVGEKLYILDAGAPVSKLLLEQGKDMKNIKGLFLSHFHGDHMDGGVSLLTLCDWYFKEAAFENRNSNGRKRQDRRRDCQKVGGGRLLSVCALQ